MECNGPKAVLFWHESQSTAVAAARTAFTRRLLGEQLTLKLALPAQKAARTSKNCYATALDEPRDRVAAGGRRPAVHRRAVRVLGISDGVLQRRGWLRGLEDGSAPDRCVAGYLGRGRARVSRETGPRADAAADIRRRINTRGAGQGRGPLRAATDTKRRVRHGMRPASSIGFSSSAFDHLH